MSESVLSQIARMTAEHKAEEERFWAIADRMESDPGFSRSVSATFGFDLTLSDPDGKRRFVELVENLGERHRTAEAIEAELYSNIAAILDGETERLKATIAPRTDGQGLMYAGKVNTLFGDPEAGKSLVATAVCVQALQDGGRVLWIDLDHNGAQETVSRFVAFGAPLDALRDPARFRFLDNPDDEADVLRAVEGARQWKPTVAVVDSMGELIPLFGGNSDNADDFTSINRRVNSALADTGAAVIAIDHLAKGEGSRSYGAGGTMAKKRAANGSYLRVENVKAFAPGQGGKSLLRIVKDRPGDVRANSPRASKGAPEAAAFDLSPDGSFRFWAPGLSQPTATQTDPRFAEMEKMHPLTIRTVKEHFGIGQEKAKLLLEQFNARAPF